MNSCKPDFLLRTQLCTINSILASFASHQWLFLQLQILRQRKSIEFFVRTLLIWIMNFRHGNKNFLPFTFTASCYHLWTMNFVFITFGKSSSADSSSDCFLRQIVIFNLTKFPVFFYLFFDNLSPFFDLDIRPSDELFFDWPDQPAGVNFIWPHCSFLFHRRRLVSADFPGWASV